MKKKTAALLSSCAAIAVCSSLIVGSTYALFTSESKVNIAVTSGKVEVVANIGDLTVNSLNGYEAVGETEVALPNGGEVKIDGNSVILNGITPGDEVAFAINVDNTNTTVSAKYRVSYTVESGYLLADDLDIVVGGVQGKYKSYSSVWSNELEDTYSVEIAMPNHTDSNIDNLYMGLTTSISFKVEAVQANGVIGSGEEEYELLPDYTDVKEAYLAGTLTVANSAEDLTNVFKKSGSVILSQNITTEPTGNYYIYKDSNIDLNGYDWTIESPLRSDATKDYVELILGAKSSTTYYIPKVEIKNGTLNLNSEKNGMQNCGIQVAYGSELKLSNVELNVPHGGGILALDPNTNIEISDSNITTASYAVSTNGTIGWGGANVTITNTNIEQTDATLTGAALLFNNVGNYTVDGCTVTGNAQAIFARSGDVTISNSTLHSNGIFEGLEWQDGSRAPSATVIVGGSGSAYQAANVSIYNCAISAEGNAVNLCVWANVNGTVLNTDLVLDGALVGTDEGGVLTINGVVWENN